MRAFFCYPDALFYLILSRLSSKTSISSIISETSKTRVFSVL